MQFFSWDFSHRLGSVPVANHKRAVNMLVNQYASVWKASSSGISEVVPLINLPLIAQVVLRGDSEARSRVTCHSSVSGRMSGSEAGRVCELRYKSLTLRHE